MKTMIVAGGPLSPVFLQERIEAEKPDYLIAADRGLDVLLQTEYRPDLLLGDFDSTRLRDPRKLCGPGTECLVYPPEKDLSDLELALNLAVERKSTHISILGAAGGRMDHFLANLLDLQIPLLAGIPAEIEDEQNRICLRDRSFEMFKENCFGKYISLLSLHQEMAQVSLRGFKYSGEGICLRRSGASYGISNEIVDRKAEVEFQNAVLVVVESKDG